MTSLFDIISIVYSFVLAHFLELIGIGLALVVAMIVYSRPEITRGKWRSCIEYRTGSEVVSRPYTVAHGPFPWFNRFLYTLPHLETLSFVDALFELNEESAEEPKLLEQNLYWLPKYKGKKCGIYLRRKCLMESHSHVDLELKVTRERSRRAIRDKIATKVDLSQPGSVVATIDNGWGMDVTQFELAFSVSSIDGLSVVRVDKIDGAGQMVPFNLKDFQVCIVIPFDDIEKRKGDVISSRHDFDIIAYLDLPAKTRIMATFCRSTA